MRKQPRVKQQQQQQQVVGRQPIYACAGSLPKGVLTVVVSDTYSPGLAWPGLRTVDHIHHACVSIIYLSTCKWEAGPLRYEARRLFTASSGCLVWSRTHFVHKETDGPSSSSSSSFAAATCSRVKHWSLRNVWIQPCPRLVLRWPACLFLSRALLFLLKFRDRAAG